MKCPKCDSNHRRSGGMTCSCGYEFALDPKMDGIGDRRFVAFINGASSNGAYSFTENQLYTAACRKQLGAPIGYLAFFCTLIAIVTTLMLIYQVVDIVPLAVIGACGLGILLWLYRLYVQSLPRKKFDCWFEKYVDGRGPIELLVEEGTLASPPESTGGPDIYDYGVERVLIVQRRVLVDLLVANNAHSTNRALIVSSDGYPDYLSPMVEKVLGESPSLPIFLLHDATIEWIAWAEKQKDRYSGTGRPVIDMGMHPESMSKIKKIMTLRLSKSNYQAPLDVLPMAMLMNGITLSMDQGVGMGELLIMETSADSAASFG